MTRDEILKSEPESPWTEIEIREWGGTFPLRPLSGRQSEEVGLLNAQAKETGSLMCLRGLSARVTTWTVCNEQRELLFRPADADTLTDKHFEVCTRVYVAVLKANRLSEGAAAVEDAAKN